MLQPSLQRSINAASDAGTASRGLLQDLEKSSLPLFESRLNQRLLSMGDWEDEDWETAEVKLPVKAPAAPSTKAEQTKGEAALATAVNEPDASKFADEDAEAEPEKDYGVVKSQVSSSGNQSIN